MSPNNYTRRTLHGQTYQTSSLRIKGDIVGDTLVKRVYSSRHMLRKPKGWAIDKDAIDEIRRIGLRFIGIHDFDTGAIFRCTTEKFIRYAIGKHYPGYGEQLALTLRHWTVINSGESEPIQLSIFGD